MLDQLTLSQPGPCRVGNLYPPNNIGTPGFSDLPTALIMFFFPFLLSVENVCPLCHKSFKKNYLMKKHFELIHEGKKSYQCHQCAHLFATKAGLIHHQQHVHEGIKFHCQVCRNNDTMSCKESAIGFFSILAYTPH